MIDLFKSLVLVTVCAYSSAGKSSAGEPRNEVQCIPQAIASPVVLQHLDYCAGRACQMSALTKQASCDELPPLYIHNGAIADGTTIKKKQ